MARTLDDLARNYPEKTGAELLEMQVQDVADEKKEYEKRNKKTLAMIEDYNKNGAYFKGTFGQDQYYMYNCTNFKMCDRGNVTMNVDSLTIFNCDNKKENTFHLELRTERFENMDRFGLHMTERITKKEWDEAMEYMHGFRPKFWKKIDMGE